MKEVVEEVLEAVVAHGDLLQLQDTTHHDSAGSLLYAAPPSFVRRASGAVMLLGVAPDGTSPLSGAPKRFLEYFNHVRVIRGDGTDDVAEQLTELGLVELPLGKWMKAPRAVSPATLLEDARARLAASPPCGETQGLMILDPAKPVTYYRGRWVETMATTGTFVARRPQAYGADLWCFTQVEDGIPRRVLDLPYINGDIRGCDAAWQLQAAIDDERGKPQVCRKRKATDDAWVVDFYSPVVMWARRRWNAIGEPAAPDKSLFAYRFSNTEIEEEIEFITRELWLAELAE